MHLHDTSPCEHGRTLQCRRQRTAGLDVPIVNNYGVWMDEFSALGLTHTLECSWPDAVCFFGEDNKASACGCGGCATGLRHES